MRRSWFLSVLAAVAALMVPTPTQAVDEGRFFDPRCDVYGFDYASGEHFDDGCSGIDMGAGLVDSTRKAILLYVSYRDLNAGNTQDSAPYVLWLDTDTDARPDWQIRFAAEGNFEELAKVDAWIDDSPTVVSCAGLVTDVSLSDDSSRLVIPRQCVQSHGAFRFNLQSRNRYDQDRSWERDCYPEVRTWSTKVRHDT